MCTAITYQTADHYFGRNLDYEHPFPCMVTITPRNLILRFRNGTVLDRHFAMIGMSIVEDDYPLYFDATNEYGLSIAGLNFPGNAVYLPEKAGMDNIAPFEFIPWILGDCENISQVREKLKNLNLVDIPYSEKFPLSDLHWIIADRERSIVLESTVEGIRLYDNPVNILTNNPPFEYHL